jgi:hypothetical protein
LRRVIITQADTGISRSDYFVERSDGAWIHLLVDDVKETAINKQVHVDGDFQSDGSLRVSTLTVDEAVPADIEISSEPLITASPKKVAVLLFNFTNDTSQPITTASAQTTVFTATNSSNAFWKEVSFGARSLVGKNAATGDVYGWFTISATNTTCDYSNWGTAARNAAAAAGVDLSGYDHIVHYFPRASSCSFSGVGQLPGKYTWINGSGAQTISHELGHNFGLHHASSDVCTSGSTHVSISSTCTLNEYGDPFDVMGSGFRHENAYQKGRLGFFEASNMVTATATGDFDVVPIEQKATGIQSLRVAIPGTKEFYYVEYRQPFGFDSFRTTDPVANGVLVHRALDYATLVRPALIDTVPSTTTFTDAALTVGHTFTDPEVNISITLTARTASAATVHIAIGGSSTGSGGAPGAGGTTAAGGSTGSGGTMGTGGSTGTGGTMSGCAAGESAFGGHCYFLDTSARNNNSAASLCTARGAGYHLATIESAAENTFVAGLVGSADTWLGGGDAVTEGTFVWTTGQTFWTGGASGTAAGSSYVNFVSGEPNDSGGGTLSGADCLRMISGGGWRDASCGDAYRTLCEK